MNRKKILNEIKTLDFSSPENTIHEKCDATPMKFIVHGTIKPWRVRMVVIHTSQSI